LPATSIANADVKWSGGTAADTFKLADNSIYAGRWAGATVTVTDLATVAPVAPFSADANQQPVGGAVDTHFCLFAIAGGNDHLHQGWKHHAVRFVG